MAFIDKITKGLKKPSKKGYVLVNSFNEESIKSLKSYKQYPEYLIVGTLTPFDGRDINGGNRNGYFYCSERNRLYKYIDSAFFNDDLQKAKQGIRDGIKDRSDIQKILADRRILFFDVVDKAYVDNKSARDDDIDSFSLDDTRFAIIDYSKIKKIIANSINAYKALEEISNKCPGLKQAFDDKKVVLIPQQYRGYSSNPKGYSFKPTYNSVDEFEDAWRNFR